MGEGRLLINTRIRLALFGENVHMGRSARGLMIKTPNALYTEIFDIKKNWLVKDPDGWLPSKEFQVPPFCTRPYTLLKRKEGIQGRNIMTLS